MTNQDEPFLQPDLDDDSRGFWEGCAVGELRVQRCHGCGHRQFPPRQMCPTCRSFDLGWEPMSGRGRIWSFVVTHPPLLPAYASHAPYPVVVVELDEDARLRMVGNLVSQPGAPIDSIDPATIEIGEPVEVWFEPPAGDGGVSFPRWLRVRETT
jgi:uncharacterized OB-fold protein